MTFTERIEKVVSDRESDLEKDSRFVELKAFYEKMKQNGLVLKREYDLPQLDTIGRGLYITDVQRLRK